MFKQFLLFTFISIFFVACGGGGNPLGDATDFEDNHGDNSIVRENRAPVLLNPGQQNWTEGAVNVININDADTGTDFDDYGDAISYTCYYDTFVDGVVAKSSECISLGGVSFDANTGSLQWVPDFDQGGVTVGAAAGSISYEFIVTGRDSYFNGPLEDEIIFVGVVNDTNDYPVIDAIGTQSVDEGSMLSVDVADGGDDQDIDTETLSYTCFYDNVVDNNVASTNACSSLTGATFNTSTGVLSWTPDYTMGGNTVGGNEDYEFRVHAYDTYTTADLAPALQGPLTDDEYFDVNVDHVNRPPSLNPMADDSVLEGQALATLDPSDTNGGGDIDFDGEPITYTCYYDQTDNDTVSEIPGNLCSTLTGISFTASTGRLDWTPNFLQAGVYEFVFVGQDNSGEPDDIDRVYTTITVVNVPSVGLTNPVNGIYINATTNSTTYPVDGTCSEAGQTVWIDIDGANAASPVGFVCDGTNYSGTIDTTVFSQGARGFQAFLTDAWTQTVSSNVNTITYDTVYPSIGINSPSEGSYINIASDSASFTFTGTCSENTQTVNGAANGISFSGYSNPTCDGANFNGTFDSTALAEGVLSLTASVSDAAGNVSESVAVSVTRDVTRPTLPNVTIFSNNSGSSTVGKAGDVVTLGIYADEALTATPTVLLAGSGATVTGSTTVWTAQYTLQAGDPTGPVAINISYNDLALNSGLLVTNTTDGSSVTIDVTPPTLDVVTILSNNSDTGRAKVGDTVSVGVIASETLASDPTMTVDGQTMTITGSGVNWTGTYVLAGGENEGALNFTVTYMDLATNSGTPTVATTDGTSVVFDETLPSLGTIEIASDATDTTRSRVGDTITLSLIGTEALLATPTVLVENQTATVAGSGVDWTATYTMTGTDTEGTIDFTVTYYDLASNGAVDSTMTTNGSSVIFDRQVPTLSNVTMYSSNVNPELAAIGDTVTVGIYASEDLLATPNVTLSNQVASVAGGTNVWTATYVMSGVEAEGVLSLSVTFSDLAYNDGVDVLTTTDGSGVEFDNSEPALTNVTIFSNNAYDTSLATTGNTITIGFTADEDLLASPTVNVFSNPANVSGSGSTWTATYLLTGLELEGVTEFTITFSDTSGNGPVSSTETTDLTSVTFDRTSPDLNVFEVISNNLDTTLAKEGDQVTLSIIGSEALLATPTVLVQSQTATVVGSGVNWTATYTFLLTDTEGVVEHTVTFYDLTGNGAVAVSATTNSSSVRFDRTKPTLPNFTMVSNNTVPTLAKAGDVVTAGIYSSESLQATPTVHVLGGNATLSGSGTVWSATYTIQGSDTEGPVDISITFSDLASNEGVQVLTTTDASNIIFDNTLPTIPNVSIFSDNADPTRALVGDTISLGFSGLESLMATPTVEIASFAATVTGGPLHWTASYLMSGLESTGVLDLSITFNDLAGNVGTPTVATTDGSSVTFDQTPPTLSNVTIFSNNADTTRAKVGDTVTIGIYADETLAADPTITVDGQTMSIAGSSSVWTGTYVMAGGESETVLDFTVTYQDTTGNVGTPTVATTDGSSVTFDETLPSLGTIELATNATDTTRAKAGDTITFSLIGSEALLATPTVLVENQTATVVGSGFDWTATYAFAGTETQGTVDFTVTYYDLTSNGAVDSTMSTNVSAVIFDSVVPTLPNVTMFSSNADSTFAVIGDTITVGIYASEALLATPTASVDSQSMNLTGSSMVWTATYVITGSENEGVLPLSITFTDLAYNDGVDVLTTTDGSGVDYDNSPPSLSNVTIFSDNADTTRAKALDTITIGFTADENLQSSPSVTILATSATVTGSGSVWTATYTTVGGENDGVVDFTITYSDVGGNPGTPTVSTTDSSQVIFDEVNPSLDALEIVSNNPDTTRAKVGDTITLSIVGAEALLVTPTVDIASQSATVVGSGLNWTATYVMTSSENTGSIDYTVTYYDLASNGAVVSTITTNSSAVDFDKTLPSLDLVTMSSSNGISTLAAVGDTITVGIYADEILLATPTVDIDNNSASVTGSGMVWTASYAMTNSDVDGVVDVSITYLDLASNVGVQALSTTDGSVVTFDKTAPTLPNVTIFSDNAVSQTLAIAGDVVSLAFYGDESLTATPTVTIAGSSSVTITGGPTAWTSTYLMTGGEPTGAVEFTVTYSDLAGNPGLDVTSTTDGSTVGIDVIPPTLTNVSIISNNANYSTLAKENDVVTLAFTADENLTATPTVTIDGSSAATITGGPITWSADYTILSTTTEAPLAFTITYTDIAGLSGTPTVASTDNTTVTVDLTAPNLTTVDLVSDATNTYMAKDGDNVIATIIASEALYTSPTVNILGNPSTVSGSGVNWTGTYNIIGLETQGDAPVSINFTDLAGNTGTTVTTLTSGGVEYDRQRPQIPNVTILSNNVDPTLALVGDTITVALYATEALEATPVVSIASQTATVIGSAGVWSASYQMTSTDNQGVVDFTITAFDLAYNSATPTYATTDGTSVNFDRANPSLTNVTILSDNSDITRAKVGDIISVGFYGDESLMLTPTVTILAQPATVTGSGDTWTATYLLVGGEDEGVVDFTISYNDLAGNAGTPTYATTDSSQVIFDETNPTLSTLEIASDNTDTTRAKVGDEIILSIIGSEALMATPTVSIEGQTPTVVGDGLNWTATYTMTISETDGFVEYTVTYYDLASNGAVVTTETTNASNVLFDKTKPVLIPVTISSSNANPVLAAVGDTITVGFYADESLLATPTVDIASVAASVTGSGSVWTATYVMTSSENEGAIPLSITYYDLASNEGVQVLSTTDGSSVDFDKTDPTLDFVTMFSSNTDSTLAVVGDTITVGFVADEALLATPTVTVDAKASVVTGSGRNWTATYVTQTGDTETTLAITIDFNDLYGNAGVQVTTTTDGSGVLFDESIPELDVVTIYSDNTNTNLAIVGNTITVGFISSEVLMLTPSVSIATQTADVTGSGVNWTATYQMLSTDTEGPVVMAIDFNDLAGNAGVQVVTPTDLTQVTFDKTAPQISFSTIFSNNANDTTLAKTNDQITLAFTTDEAIQSTPTVAIAGSVVSTLTGSGAGPWTATYVMGGTETDGVITLSITYNDIPGNAGVVALTTTDSSQVTYDKTAPTFNPVTISSNHVTPTVATIGDVITLEMTASEALLSSPTVAIMGTSTVSLSGMYTATYTMTEYDSEGSVVFTIDGTDLAGNVATQTTATTDASSVTFSKIDMTDVVEPADAVYSDNAEIYFQAVYESTVTVGGVPRIILDVGGVTKYAVYDSGSGTNAIEFKYTVIDGDTDADGIELAQTTIDLNGGSMAHDNIVATRDLSPMIAALTNVQVDTSLDAPDQVTNVVAGPTSDNTKLSITWNVPNDNGTAITHYIVQFREQGSSEWSQTSPNPSSNTEEIDGLTAGTTYEIRVAADNGVVGPYSNIQTAQIFDVMSLNPIAWLDANNPSGDGSLPTNGSKIASWVDLTGTATDATETSSAEQPTIVHNSLNGLPTIRFDGHSKGLEGEFTRVNNGGLTIFLVAKMDDNSVREAFFEFYQIGAPTSGASSRRGFFFTYGYSEASTNYNLDDNNYNLWRAIDNGTQSSLYENGVSWYTDINNHFGNTDFTGAGGYVLGDDLTGGDEFNGNIAEFLIFDSNLSAGDITTIETYLYNKWGINIRAVATGVSISSNNSDSTRATVNDVITLGITVSESLTSTPTVTFEGNAADSVVGSGVNWTATYTMRSGDSDGNVDFTIDMTDDDGNVSNQKTTTTDGSSVTFDKAVPTLSNVTMFSNNSDSTRAKSADTITVGIIASETLISSPVVSIAGENATVTGSSTFWTATFTLDGTETDGVASLSITFSDEASNDGTPVTATTDSSIVTIDFTPPSLSSVTMFSTNANTSLAVVGDTVTVSIIASESLLATPSVDVNLTSADIEGSGSDWTATYVLTSTDLEGALPVSITYFDLASNPGAQVLTTTNNSSVTFDKTLPTFNPVTIYSNHVTPTVATIGDTLTLEMTASEILNASPTVTLVGTSTVNLSGSYTATYTLNEYDTEGTVTFSIDGIDPSGNAAIQVTTTTDATSVTFSKIDMIDVVEPADAVYSDNAEIYFQAVYESTVTVAGSPRIILDVGGVTKYADYDSGSGSTAIEFKYTVIDGDTDADGIELGQTTIDLNGGTMTYANIVATRDLSPLVASLANVQVNTALDAPDKVTNVVAGPTSDNTKLSITWNVPNDNGTTIVDYIVQFREQGSSTWSQTSPNPTSNFDDIDGLTAGTTYEIRIAANNGVVGPYSDIQTAEIFDVMSLNPIAWLDANNPSGNGTLPADNSKIATWVDLTGVAVDASETNATYQPTIRYNTFNGLPAIQFDDLTQGLEGGFTRTGGTNYTVFLVGQLASSSRDNGCFFEFKPDSGSSNRAVFKGHKWGSSDSGEYPIELARDQVALWRIEAAGTSGTVTENRSVTLLNGTTNDTDFTGAGYYILGDDYNGDQELEDTSYIAEFLIFDSALSVSDIQKIEDYLENKWGTPASPPSVSSVTIYSDNANDTTLAKVGDTISVDFTVTESLAYDPTVTVEGQDATITSLGGLNYRAQYAMTSGENNGKVNIVINMTDLDGLAAYRIVDSTDGSEVTFDKDVPTLDAVNMFSNNGNNTGYAKQSDVVTVEFIANESLLANPTILAASQTMTMAGSGVDWTGTYTMGGTDAEGTMTLVIDFFDLAGNHGTQVITTTNGSGVIYDRSDPVVTVTTPTSSETITIFDHTSYTTYGTCSENGSIVSLTISDSTNPDVTATPTCTSSAWTSTVDVSSLNDGSISFTAAQTDIPGNTGNDSTSPTKATSPAVVTISDIDPYDFGTVDAGQEVYKTFTISNTSADTAANSLTETTLSGAYSYRGGSYPGVGGTCTTLIGTSSSCTVVLAFAPTVTGATYATMTFNYNDGDSTESESTDLLGTGNVDPISKIVWDGPSGAVAGICTPYSIESQNDSNFPVDVASDTIVSLTINNGSGTFYEDSGCLSSTTTVAITSGNSDATVYFSDVSAPQNLTFIGTTAGLDNASYAIGVGSTPVSIVVAGPGEVETDDCTEFSVSRVDTYGNKLGDSATNIDLTNDGSLLFYSDAFCASSITNVAFGTTDGEVPFYVKGTSNESITLTGGDQGAVLVTGTFALDVVNTLTWWDSNWDFRRAITISNLDQTITHSDMQVLVKLDFSRIDYSQTQNSGQDIRFLADDHTTELKYEIETWDETGTSYVWVKVPSITGSANTTIYMYYGNTGASDDQDSTNTWSTHWGVWHLDEDPTGGAPQYSDSTGGGKDGTAVNSPAQTTGVVGNGVDFNGTDDTIDVGALESVLGSSSTMSFWIKSSQTGNNTNWKAPGITGVEQAGGANDIFYGHVRADGSICMSAGNGTQRCSNFVVNDTAWRHVTITRSSVTGNVEFYVNGVLNGSGTSNTGDKTTSFSKFGWVDDTGGTPVDLNGYVDEIRIHSTVKDSERVMGEFKYQNDSHLSYGSEVAKP